MNRMRMIIDHDHDHDFLASDSECGELRSLRIKHHQGFRNSLEMCIPPYKEMQQIRYVLIGS